MLLVLVPARALVVPRLAPLVLSALVALPVPLVALPVPLLAPPVLSALSFPVRALLAVPVHAQRMSHLGCRGG